jgi:hypothetical protein
MRFHYAAVKLGALGLFPKQILHMMSTGIVQKQELLSSIVVLSSVQELQARCVELPLPERNFHKPETARPPRLPRPPSEQAGRWCDCHAR